MIGAGALSPEPEPQVPERLGPDRRFAIADSMQTVPVLRSAGGLSDLSELTPSVRSDSVRYRSFFSGRVMSAGITAAGRRRALGCQSGTGGVRRRQESSGVREAARRVSDTCFLPRPAESNGRASVTPC